jgi:transposase
MVDLILKYVCERVSSYLEVKKMIKDFNFDIDMNELVFDIGISFIERDDTLQRGTKSSSCQIKSIKDTSTAFFNFEYYHNSSDSYCLILSLFRIGKTKFRVHLKDGYGGNEMCYFEDLYHELSEFTISRYIDKGVKAFFLTQQYEADKLEIREKQGTLVSHDFNIN